jgi:hypothetical protein
MEQSLANFFGQIQQICLSWNRRQGLFDILVKVWHIERDKLLVSKYFFE